MRGTFSRPSWNTSNISLGEKLNPVNFFTQYVGTNFGEIFHGINFPIYGTIFESSFTRLVQGWFGLHQLRYKANGHPTMENSSSLESRWQSQQTLHCQKQFGSHHVASTKAIWFWAWFV